MDYDYLALRLPLFSILFVLLTAMVIRGRQSSRYPLPPGPPIKSIFGHEFPAYSFRQFYQWTLEYGPLISLRRGRQHFVVIGTMAAAHEIMEKHGSVLADRPRSVAAGEIVSRGMRILLIEEESRVKRYRRALHERVGPGVAGKYEPIQRGHTRALIRNLFHDPANHIRHVKAYAAGAILSITYGHPIKNPSSELLRAISIPLQRAGQALRPGTWLVDSFPLLKYLPFYLNQLRQWHRDELKLFTDQLDDVRRGFAADTANDSFGSYLIEHQKTLQLTDNEAAYLAGSMFGAGSDTTAAAISFALMAAALHPKEQAAVQQELDTMIGRERLPEFVDETNLPRLVAFIQESLRWRPVSIGGFPHRATQDVIYNGYCIPRGTTVIGNHWAISRDSVAFPNPHNFEPERWLTKDGQMRRDMKFPSFGFGRRSCPGAPVANRSLFLTLSNIFWTFHVSEVPDSPINPDAISDTANTHPDPFKLTFEPRAKGLEKFFADDAENMP